MTGSKKDLLTRLVVAMLETGELTKEQAAARAQLAGQNLARWTTFPPRKRTQESEEDHADKARITDGTEESSKIRRSKQQERISSMFRQVEQAVGMKERELNEAEERARKRKASHTKMKQEKEELEDRDEKRIQEKRWSTFLSTLKEKENMLYTPMARGAAGFCKQDAIDSMMGLTCTGPRSTPKQDLSAMAEEVAKEESVPSIKELKRRHPNLPQEDIRDIIAQAKAVKKGYEQL